MLLFLALSYLYRHTQKASPSRGRCPAGADEVEAAFGTMSNNYVFASPTSSVSLSLDSSLPEGAFLFVFLLHFCTVGEGFFDSAPFCRSTQNDRKG